MGIRRKHKIRKLAGAYLELLDSYPDVAETYARFVALQEMIEKQLGRELDFSGELLPVVEKLKEKRLREKLK